MSLAQDRRPLYTPLVKCFFSTSTTVSISASVVSLPRLKRIAPRASAGSVPMATSTCEAFTVLPWQAAPGETAMPRQGLHDRYRIEPLKADVPCVRKLLFRMAVQMHLQPNAFQSFKQSLTELYLAGPLGIHDIRSDHARSAHADDERRVLRARTQAALMPCPVHHRKKLASVLDIQSADPFRGIELVAGYGQKIHAKIIYLHAHLAHALRSVGVEQHITGTMLFCSAP